MNVAVDAVAPADRLVAWWSRSRARHVAAPITVGGAVAVLELQPLQAIDHGTHLLIALSLVIGIALVFGARPAATGFIAGGVLALSASAITARGVLGPPQAVIQLLVYAAAGAAVILFVGGVVRRGRSTAGPGAAGRPAVATPPPGHWALTGPLTARECEVLQLAASGIPVDEIARRLFVSPNTAKTHLAHIYGKLGAHGRSEAIRVALHCGCLTPRDICPHQPGGERAESPVRVIPDHPQG